MVGQSGLGRGLRAREEGAEEKSAVGGDYGIFSEVGEGPLVAKDP